MNSLSKSNREEEKAETVEKEEDLVVWIDGLKRSDSAVGEQKAVEW